MPKFLLAPLALSLAACSAPPPMAEGGIISLNPCADAMLVAMLPADRIAAISPWSKDAQASSLPPEVARRFAATGGTAEEVIALRPKLVVASSFTPPATRTALARAGIATLYLDSPTTIAASKAQVAELAAAVGAPAAGRALNARIDRAVAAAAPPPGAAVPALLWIGGDLATGSGNLLDEMLTRAGFANQAARYGLTGTGSIPAERVIADPPRVMLLPEGEGRTAAARAQQLRAHALAIMGRPVLEARYSRRLVNCGGPVIVDAMARLATIRRSVAQ